MIFSIFSSSFCWLSKSKMTSKLLKLVHDIINPLYDVAFHDGLSPEFLTRTSRNLRGIPFLANRNAKA